MSPHMFGTRRAAIAAATWHLVGSLAPSALNLLLQRRVRRGKEDPARLDERRGLGAPPPAAWQQAKTRIWLHAASVGETVSILPVIAALATHPSIALLVTTGTRTGAEILARRAGDTAIHRFLPHDVPRWIGRFLDRWQPQVAGFVDSEIWPNTLAALRRRGIPAVLLNGRLSAASFRRWAMVGRLLGGTPFGLLTAVAARGPEDAARLAALGAPRAVRIGDLKQAGPPLPVDPDRLAALREAIGTRPVWLAASTHPGEEAIAARVHDALAAAHPGLLTLIAPRHPERGAEIAAAIGAPRRGIDEPLPTDAGVYVWDTLGELGLLYRAAPIVFVGNSLGGVAHGGHNPFEPARCGAAIATGPRTGNFRDAVAALTAAGGLSVVAGADALAEWVERMLADPAARRRQAAAAASIADAERDLPAQLARLLLEHAGR